MQSVSNFDYKQIYYVITEKGKTATKNIFLFYRTILSLFLPICATAIHHVLKKNCMS